MPAMSTYCEIIKCRMETASLRHRFLFSSMRRQESISSL